MSSRLVLPSLLLILAALPAQAQSQQRKLAQRRPISVSADQLQGQVVLEGADKTGWRIVERQPPTLTDSERLRAAIFRSLWIETKLTDSAGEHPHPDLALLAALRELMAQGQERKAFARCSELLLYDSRLEVFRLLASRPKLSDADREAIVAAALGGAKSPLFAPTLRDKIRPGGAETLARYKALALILAREDLSLKNEEAIAKACPRLGSDAYEAAILKTLCARDRLPTPKILTAMTAISDSSQAYAVAVALIKKRKSRDDAHLIARFCRELGADVYERAVLLALVTTTAINVEDSLKTADAIGPVQYRYEVLLALLKREAGDPVSVKKIAAYCPSLRSDIHERAVLITLIHQAQLPLEPAIVAARSLGSVQSRYEVYTALSSRKNMSPAQAQRLARVCPSLGSDVHEQALLLTLIKRKGLALESALLAAESLASVQHRYEVLNALIGRGRLDPQESERLSQAGAALGSDAHERAILLTLINRSGLSLEAALAASDSLASVQYRYEVLILLAGREGLSAAQARQLARVCPSLGSDAHEYALLLSLIKKRGLSLETALTASDSLASVQHRYDILTALVERGGLSQSGLERLAKASTALGSDAHERALLSGLIDRGLPVSSALKAADSLASVQYRYEVLTALAQRKEKKPAEIELLAEACPGLSSDSHERALLLLLIRRGGLSVTTAIAVSRKLSSVQYRYDALLALAKRAGLGRQDADRIAAACPSLGSDHHESALLLALVAKASREAVEDAARSLALKSESDRVRAALRKAGKKRRRF